MCNPLKENPIFRACEAVVEVAPFYDACKNDLCSDANHFKRQLYQCRAFAAYAHECADKGILINWLNDYSLKGVMEACYTTGYGKCFGGSEYSECSRTVNTTCKDLFLKHNERYSNSQDQVCVAGCSCPEDHYFDIINNQLQCVPRSSCTCYDIGTNKYYQPNEKVKRSCAEW